MESLLIQNESQGVPGLSVQASLRENKAAIDSSLIENISNKKKEEGNSYQRAIDSFSFTAQKVLEKLNSILAPNLPGGIESLQPNNHTPEKTADRIVTQISALYGVYSKQNADKSPEELVSGFMKLARSGVEQGYGEAFGILEDIGAFELDGIQSGVEKTKELIDQKLDAFEKYLSEKLGLVEKEVTKEDFIAPVKDNLLAQGGANLDVTA